MQHAMFIAVYLPLLTAAAALPLTSTSNTGGNYFGSDSSGGQVPFRFPLPNGFPKIQVPSSALTAIQEQAHGTLPNTPLPSSLADASATTFQAIAFGELFEVAYFSALLSNITNNVSGFDVGSGAVRDVVVEALTAVQAQEELHAIGVNAILSTAGRTPVQACEYIFPVDNFDASIAGASTFTDTVVLGGLQDALNTFATDGDTEVVSLLASVLGQEGEQNGFYRSLQQKIPSALPFLTRSTGPFAFSFINQNFIVPGSCPTTINVPVFSKLNIDTRCVEATTTQVDFSFTKNQTQATENLHLVYINQQNAPIVEKLQNIHTEGDDVTFSATFPYRQNLMNGLTICVLTNGAGPFTSADAVANATVFGPAIIEIN